MKDNSLFQFVILVLAVTAGQLLLKFGASFLPATGFAGSVKNVISSL
jgi:hypothetical protein